MPERPRRVVVNSTPVIALALINELRLLKNLYEQVLIPPAVQAEVLAGGIKCYAESRIYKAVLNSATSLMG